jgi:hypothetical protein
MSVVKSHQIQKSLISFSDVKSNDNGGKSVYINYNSNKFYLQTPIMTMPYNMSCYDKGDYPKYSLEVSFRDMDEDHRVRGFHENMEMLEKMMIQEGLKNSMPWFKKKSNKVDEDLITALMTPLVKKSIDKETGDPDGKYPDTLRFKLPIRDGKIQFKVYDFDGNRVDSPVAEDLFVKGARVQIIARCGGVWVVGGKFGCTWTIEKVKVDAPKSIKEYSFVDDGGSSDEDDEVEDTSDEDDDE